MIAWQMVNLAELARLDASASDLLYRTHPAYAFLPTLTFCGVPYWRR
jgi:hypothetical protein